jgi:hypothetical protein
MSEIKCCIIDGCSEEATMRILGKESVILMCHDHYCDYFWMRRDTKAYDIQIEKLRADLASALNDRQKMREVVINLKDICNETEVYPNSLPRIIHDIKIAVKRLVASLEPKPEVK